MSMAKLENLEISPEDPSWLTRVRAIHAATAWTLFTELQFAQAYQHFTYAPDESIYQLLAFWRRLLPVGWEGPKVATSTGSSEAPEPRDIEEFVHSQLLSRQSGHPGAASQTTTTVAAANSGLVTFLLKQRSALQAQERMSPQDPHDESAASQSLRSLLQAVDTVLLKLLVEAQADDERLQELLGKDPRCVVEDCEDFLRGRGRCDLLAHLWKARGKYDLVLKEWSQILRTATSSSGTSSVRSVQEEAVQEMVGALVGAWGDPNCGVLLQKYVPELIAVDRSSVLKIFTSTQSPLQPATFPLSVDAVLQLLGEHEPLVLAFLEHAVAQRRPPLNVEHKLQIALLYLSKVMEELRFGVKMGPVRVKLLSFLEHADVSMGKLLPKMKESGLHHEQTVLLFMEGRHQEALTVLVKVLDDLPHAESYCHIVSAMEAEKAARGSGSASIGKLPSIFTNEPPAWARPLAFGVAKSSSSSNPAAAAEEAQRQGRSPGPPGAAANQGLEKSGMQDGMLFLLLRTLVDAALATERGDAAGGAAAEGSQTYKRSSEDYRGAAINLLTTYAAHRDLPPHKVLKLLPSSWTLASLAEYLSKAGRFSLHERRVSMLEENLGSMAYLKTYNAWAQERMRKVNITGDRCCPVCNRRFVGKDSVGKAFAAYPNGTCVHVQCQQDPSICPKTGRNFADSASVYGYALGHVPET